MSSKSLLIIILAVIFNAIYLSAQPAKGIVFSDNNKNGKRDKGENGIANVAVSNGSDVVHTDKSGYYSITAPVNSVIFVIKPAGYNLPLNEVNVPQFYYLHYPDGFHKLRYASVKPTGDLPGSIDFALIPTKESNNFKALFFGDTQPYNLKEVDYLANDVISELAGSSEYIFGTILGDVVGDDLSLYSAVSKTMSFLNMPVFYVPGNHDMNYDVTDDNFANETYKASFGPRNYAFNYGKTHFVVLDNIMYSGDTISYKYQEGFDDLAITFLKNDLAHVPKDKLVVLMMHAPFINKNKLKPIINLDKILAIISAYPNTFSISGHNHTISQYQITNQYGWTQTKPHHHFNAGAACGGWWRGKTDDTGLPEATMNDGSPNGYAIITFAGNTYNVDYKVARKPASYQMNIFSPKIILDSLGVNWTNKELYVNFFTGYEKDTVRFRVNHGNWIVMRHTPEQDPQYASDVKRWGNENNNLLGSRPAKPLICTHLWKANLPSDLSAGYHKVEVEATDLFKRKHHGFYMIYIQKVNL